MLRTTSLDKWLLPAIRKPFDKNLESSIYPSRTKIFFKFVFFIYQVALKFTKFFNIWFIRRIRMCITKIKLKVVFWRNWIEDLLSVLAA